VLISILWFDPISSGLTLYLLILIYFARDEMFGLKVQNHSGIKNQLHDE